MKGLGFDSAMNFEKNFGFKNVPVSNSASITKLYMGIRLGGTSNNGTLLEYDIALNSITKKHDFVSATSGNNPSVGVKKYSNNKIYGITTAGGVNNSGTIFEFNTITGIVAKIFDFNSATSGASPQQRMTESSDGRFFGVCPNGGTSNRGVIYEFFPLTNTVTIKKNFDTGVSGTSPRISLVEFNKKLYGTTNSGITTTINGCIFEYDYFNDILTNKYSFTGNGFGLTGVGANSFVIYNNEFYGCCLNGGGFNFGTLWKFNPITNIFTLLKTFNANDILIGGQPQGLCLGSDYNIYYSFQSMNGYSGGIGKYNILTDTISVIFLFPTVGIGTFGGTPTSIIFKANDTIMYGVTFQGGTNNQGIFYKLDYASNNVNKLYDFTTASGNGVAPNLCNIYGL